MTKAYVDELIQNMKRAGIVTKTTPWMVEGFGEKQMNIRYAGIKITQEWLEIFSEKNNLLLKFIIDRNSAALEFYLANKPPFIRIDTTSFSIHDKWEILLGELRRKLKKDKIEFTNHTEKLGNFYIRIKPHVKS